MLRIELAHHVVDHCFGVEGCPVMELHILTEVEVPDEAIVRGGPVRRQVRLHYGFPRLEPHQTVVNLSGDSYGLAIGHVGGVQLGGICALREHEVYYLRWGWRGWSA